ncbi:MAG: carboxypeptidase-like regulatory domain-containing protein [candidate division FCPU426 bacterium]
MRALSCSLIGSWVLLTVVCPPAAAVWQVETVDSAGKVGWYSSLACDSQDQLHVSYFDESNGALKYARWNGSDWAVQTVDADDCGRYTSLALDAQDRPHITYAGSGLRYARWTGKKWEITQVTRDYVQFSTSLALGPDGTCQIAYNAGQRLAYARQDGRAWQIQMLDVRGGPMDCDLALDRRGWARIVTVINRSDDLKLLAWNGKAWLPNDPPATPANDGYWPSLAVDAAGGLHVSSWESNHGRHSSGNLQYRYFDGKRWFLELPDTEGDTGWYSSLALDSEGNVHVGYHNHTDWDLKYAVKRNGTWHNQVVDASGQVGYSASLALDTRGRPRISYYDVGQHDLKVARWREGTNTVSGAVVNSGPVVVFLRSQTLLASTRTDRQGRFRFDQVPTGEYAVAPAGRGRAFQPQQAFILLDHDTRKEISFTGR